MKRQRAGELRRAPTKAEALMWHSLRGLEGVSFTRQLALKGFIVDFCARRARLVLEIDGGVHDEQHSYDTERNAVLTQHGYRVLRISNEDVLTRHSDVLELIRWHLDNPLAPLPRSGPNDGASEHA